jgi:hypothetical protein
MFSLQQNQKPRGQNRFCQEAGWGGCAPTMYTHVSKAKNDKIKNNFRKKKRRDRGEKKEKSNVSKMAH